MKAIFYTLLVLLFLVSANADSIVVSTGKSVTGSGWYSVYSFANLTDGNLSVGWNAGGFSGWAQVDLGESILLDKAIFYSGAGPSSNETFSLYIDSVLVQTITMYIPQGNLVPVEFDFSDRIGRYVQINISATSSWVAGNEFEIYSTIPEFSSIFFLGIVLFAFFLRRLF